MTRRRRVDPGLSMSPTSLVMKGKPRDVKRMMADLVETHGEDATLPEVYRNTMDALMHPMAQDKN